MDSRDFDSVLFNRPLFIYHFLSDSIITTTMYDFAPVLVHVLVKFFDRVFGISVILLCVTGKSRFYSLGNFLVVSYDAVSLC